MAVTKKKDDEIYRGSDIKTKFCKNHIRVVSKEDTGRDLFYREKQSLPQKQFWGQIEIMRQRVEINNG